MSITNNVGRQRTIKFNIGYRVKKPKRKSERGTIFTHYSPKHITVKPTQYLLVNADADFGLPDRIRATIVNLPTVHGSGLKNYQTEDLTDNWTINSA